MNKPKWKGGENGLMNASELNPNHAREWVCVSGKSTTTKNVFVCDPMTSLSGKFVMRWKGHGLVASHVIIH